MILTPMQENQIFKFVDTCYLNEQYIVQITLIDGKTVLCTIRCQAFHLDGDMLPSKERCFSNNCLIIAPNFLDEYSDYIYIPLCIIAGINSISYQEILFDGSLSNNINYSRMPIYHYAFQDLLNYALKMNLQIEHFFRNGSISYSKIFAWGDLSYLTDTALYADWNYLQNISGGLNALGVGMGIFNLSSGWTESLWSQFKKKVRQRCIDICNISTENEAVIKGHISFIKRYSSLPNFKYSFDYIEMEGSKWFPAIISTKKIINNSDIKSNTWALIYLKEDGLMFPLEAWDKITNPISVYCEVVHVTISTEFGTIPFYLKVRCAAYIKE